MPDEDITDYRYNAKRKNNPPAGLAPEGKIKEAPKVTFDYNPHLPPTLRFDPSGQSDKLPELLETARQRALNDGELQTLADALQNRQPWLEWTGKREAQACEVDPVALHIHERVSAQAILRVAARQDVARNLFADPEQEYREAVQFYQHDIDWTNRLILGDSLQVMASLAKREDLAGKVQCIYMDPPYGIKYASNFQSEVGKRDVKDKPEDLTREPEMVKAYRDTWTLGVHSYLAYLRDRLILNKALLANSGSIFVQISDENLHRVRMVMDEVFSPKNFVALIQFQKTTSATNSFLPLVCDYILWYARDVEKTKYHPLNLVKSMGEEGAEHYSMLELPSGEKRGLRAEEKSGQVNLPVGARPFTSSDLTSASLGRQKGEGAACWFPVRQEGRNFRPNIKNRWKTNEQGMSRLLGAERVLAQETALRYLRYIDDFAAYGLNSIWTDVGGASDRQYVVQTATKVIERCLLMTTDPGDLVLDPTCGSGTTAYVAEQWGRRWITTDTSRVAVAIARQRLLTSKFDYYELRDPKEGVSGGFVYKTVPHVTLKSIAQNPALDPIFAEWEPILDAKLELLNVALDGVTPELRQTLTAKLELKRRKRDKSDPVTDADTRRWKLPERGPLAPNNGGTGRVGVSSPAPPLLGAGGASGAGASSGGWQHWTVPFDTDPDWPQDLQDALTDYRKAWRAKMDAVNATIAARADQEELVDKPNIEKGKLRVCGPFTVEGVRPGEESLDLDEPVDAMDEELETFGMEGMGDLEAVPPAVANTEAYLDRMLRLMKTDGVRFPGNNVVQFDTLQALQGQDPLYAEGEWTTAEGEQRRVAVAFGPEYGPITAEMVHQCIRKANRRGYDELVFAGFSFDGAAQALIQDDPNPDLRIHIAHIRPDEMMKGLLKDTANAQIFTVSGLPRAEAVPTGSGEFYVTMEGVDIYDPVANTIVSANATQVAAWFLDSDYDGGCFCITQAFFPDPKAWEKLSKALTGVVDADRFAALSGTKSLSFPVGKHKRAAVKVIDPRGNEVMKLLDLSGNGVRYGASE